MKKFLQAAVVSLAVASFPSFGHHAADGMVDDEVYAMIDSLLMDTPHADMTLDDLGAGMTELTITTSTVTSMENMIDDGLLDYASMLDGNVEIGISFADDGDVTMTVTQRP